MPVMMIISIVTHFSLGFPCFSDDEIDPEDGSDFVEPTTMRQRYFKRYYYTMANFKEREESAKRNLMKLEQRAKNFYVSNKKDGMTNLTCRNCILPFSIGKSARLFYIAMKLTIREIPTWVGEKEGFHMASSNSKR